MAVSQLPDHPGIKRACNHMAVLYLLPDSLHMIHNPAYLRGAEIGVRHQSRPLPDDLAAFMDGDIQDCIDHLIVAENAERLKESEL